MINHLIMASSLSSLNCGTEGCPRTQNAGLMSR